MPARQLRPAGSGVAVDQPSWLVRRGGPAACLRGCSRLQPRAGGLDWADGRATSPPRRRPARRIPAARRGPPTARRARSVAGRGLARASALGARGGPSGQHDRPRRGPGAAVRARAVGSGRTGWNSFRCSPRSIASSRVDLPGFGHSPMPAQADLDRRLCAHARRAAGRAGHPVCRGYRQLDGRLHRRASWRSPSPSGSSGSCWSPPRASRPTWTRAPSARCPTLQRLERVLAAIIGAGWPRARRRSRARPRLREATLRLVVRHPGCLPAALAAEQVRGRGQAGLRAGAGGRPSTTRSASASPRSPARRCRLGRAGQSDQRARRARVRRADPRFALVVFADTGHMAMLERPAAFNALLRDFLSRVALRRSTRDRRPRRRCRRAGVLADRHVEVRRLARAAARVGADALLDLLVAERHDEAARVDVDRDLVAVGERGDRPAARRPRARRGRP